MATLTSIRNRIYRHLYAAYPKSRPFQSLDTAGVTPSGTTVTVTDGNDWEEGDILEWEDGDLALVTAVATNNLTVVRDYLGSTGATHAANSLVSKNPRFTIQQIDDAIRGAMSVLGTWGIHTFGTGSVTLAASEWYYELSDTDIADNYGVLAVYYVEDTTKQPVYLPFKYAEHLSTADVDWSEGRGITIMSKGDRDTTGTLYYTYAKSYNPVSDNLSTVVALLEDQHEELVVLSATANLMGMTVVPMTQDPGRRTDRSTPPGQTSRDGRWFQGEFYIKVRAEAARMAMRRAGVGGARRTQRPRRWRW